MRHKRLIVMIVISLVLVACSAENAWTTAPDMPTERWEHSPCLVDGKIYVFGGVTGWPASAYGMVEVYDPH